MRGRLVLLTVVALVALAGWLLLGKPSAPDRPTAAAPTPSAPTVSISDPSSEPISAPSSESQQGSATSNRPGRGDVPQDTQARQQHPSTPIPTLPAASKVTDAQIHTILEADLNGQARPTPEVAVTAEQATRPWLLADIKAAGLWSQPRIRAAIAVTPTDAHNPATQVLVNVVWIAARDGQVELHRTNVDAHLVDQTWQLAPAPQDQQSEPSGKIRPPGE